MKRRDLINSILGYEREVDALIYYDRETHGGVMIVRDEKGNPKVDNPQNVPVEVLVCLSDPELLYLKQLKEAN